MRIQASSVSPSELFISDPTEVLMVDGKDRDSTVSIRVQLNTPNRSTFDFGFMNNNNFLLMTGKSWEKGGYTFAGGSIVDFALRNKGNDGLFGTADDLIHRISEGGGHVTPHYFGFIDPSRSRNPAVTEVYFQNLDLSWDLNLDAVPDMRARIKIQGSNYDGMMPVPMAVSLPTTSWLLGSGLALLGITARRRRRTA